MERGEIEGDKEEGDISIKESQKFMADSGDDEQVPNALDLFFGDSDSDDEEDDTGDGISKRQMLSRPSSPSGGQPTEGNSDSSLSSFEFDESNMNGQSNTASSFSTDSSPEELVKDAKEVVEDAREDVKEVVEEQVRMQVRM